MKATVIIKWPSATSCAASARSRRSSWGAVHLQQYADFIADVPTIGVLFLLHGLGAGVVVILLATRHAALGALGGIALSAGDQETARMIEQAGGRALAAACDVTRGDEIKAALNAAVERFGRLDVAFNNAGIEQAVKSAHEISDGEWDRLVAVNLRGAFLSMKHEIDLMLQHGGGAIVNTSSGAGVKGFKGQAAYAATKHGLIGPPANLNRTGCSERA